MNTREAEIQAHRELSLDSLIQQVLLEDRLCVDINLVPLKAMTSLPDTSAKRRPTRKHRSPSRTLSLPSQLVSTPQSPFQSLSRELFPLSAIVATPCDGVLHL